MESIDIKVLAKKSRGATKEFQSNREVFVLFSSRYLSSRWFGKFVEGVDGSDSVSGNDKEVSDEISVGYFTTFVSHWEKTCCIQCGILGDLKRF